MRDEARRWQVMSNPTWTVIGGERVEQVAYASLLVPRPAPDEPGLWMVPTALVSPMLLAAEKRFGIAVEFEAPSTGDPEGLELVTNHLGKHVLCPVDDPTAPEAVREGVRRQRMTKEGRPCPCGVPTTVDLDARRVTTMHDPTCPAWDSNLRAAVIAWLGV